jgi:hypothetical protein
MGGDFVQKASFFDPTLYNILRGEKTAVYAKRSLSVNGWRFCAESVVL